MRSCTSVRNAPLLQSQVEPITRSFECAELQIRLADRDDYRLEFTNRAHQQDHLDILIDPNSHPDSHRSADPSLETPPNDDTQRNVASFDGMDSRVATRHWLPM